MEPVENRFMFDTNALNRICDDSHDEMLIYQTKHLGWEYFFSEIQCTECGNAALKHLNDDSKEKNVNRAVDLLRIIPKLQTRYIGLIASLRRGRWLLNGTFNILPDDEMGAYELFQDILNNNDRQYYNDAMIGMTAVVHGCIVVTDDRRFFRITNQHYPGRAIRYEEFIQRVKAAIGDTSS